MKKQHQTIRIRHLRFAGEWLSVKENPDPTGRRAAGDGGGVLRGIDGNRMNDDV
ncbi:hypothetical protein [Actibacterium sp. MT2.3-13A]|uniref:hypothetical protein n=1 Tax=Actibacterium sp. MT2.3-13A TaxID=2828332 RepID=UPI001BA560B2|nr:hypothetical protein [Actibacterium sp. MT2.3-13A]